MTYDDLFNYFCEKIDPPCSTCFSTKEIHKLLFKAVMFYGGFSKIDDLKIKQIIKKLYKNWNVS